jgi:hypothetical protein
MIMRFHRRDMKMEWEKWVMRAREESELKESKN